MMIIIISSNYDDNVDASCMKANRIIFTFCGAKL